MKKIVVLIAIMLSACMARGPVIAPSSVYHQAGAEVRSPNAGDWTLIGHNMNGVAFIRTFGKPGETAVANTVIFKVAGIDGDNEFLNYIATQRENQFDKARFKRLQINNQQVTFKEVPCLQYQTLSEDHKDSGVDSTEFQYLKTTGYVCRHPANKSLAIQMEVSHRGGERLLPENLQLIAETFFQKIQFNNSGLK